MVLYAYLNSPWSHLLHPQLMQNGASCCSVPSTYRRFSNILLHWTFPLVNTHDPSFNPSVSPRPSSSLCSPPRFLLLVTHCYRVPVPSSYQYAVYAVVALRTYPLLVSTDVASTCASGISHAFCTLHSAFRIPHHPHMPISLQCNRCPSSVFSLSLVGGRCICRPSFAY